MTELSDGIKTSADILGWNQPIDYVAEDVWLALSIPQEQIPQHFLVLYARFMDLGWIEKYGGTCIFMAELLRRILKIHGFPAHFREYTRFYQNKNRGWYNRTGLNNPDDVVPATGISTHAVCVSDGYILDWAGIDTIYRQFGAMSPWAFIGQDNEEWQALKAHGEVKWQPRKEHRLTRNDKWFGRQEIIECLRRYFWRYQI